VVIRGRHRRALAVTVMITPLLALTAVSGCSSAVPVGGVRTTGPLYLPGSNIHFCTASVVNSPAGNLLVTAGHCIVGTGAGVTFAPGSVNGSAPYGTWTVVAAYADPAWISGQSPQHDIAFLKVAPQTIGGRTRTVQQVTGANHLGMTPPTPTAVVIPAYPAGVGGQPISCLNTAYQSSGYPTFDCAGYVGGVSGGPWINGSTVVGVIGGLNQGGCTDSRSYSSPFDATTVALYNRAVAATTSDTLPAAGPDGC
jgi:V8-like Glu-specific endopeptidase